MDKNHNDVWGDTDQAFYAGLRPEEIYDIHVQDIKVYHSSNYYHQPFELISRQSLPEQIYYLLFVFLIVGYSC